MKGISNITVAFYGSDSDRACASWESGDARFHVYFHAIARSIYKDGFRRPGQRSSEAKPIIYKNSIADHGKPGYFNTRKLDAESPGNVAILEYVFTTINREGLIAKARVAKVEADLAEEKKRKQDAIDHRVDEFRKLLPFLKEKAQPEMIDALSDVLSLDDLDELKARFP